MTQQVEFARAFANDGLPRRSPGVLRLAGRDDPRARPTAPRQARMQRHLLVLQFATFNLAAFALLGAIYMQGWIDIAVAADGTKLSVVMFLVFLCGFAVCAGHIWQISRELECVRNFNPCRCSWAATYLAEVAGRGSGSRAITGSALRVRVANRIALVRHVANGLVLLGLIGTVLGFIIALSGVDPDVAGDVRAVAPMVSKLIAGMSVALYTTLTGAVFSLWLTVNHHMLVGGAVRLVTALITLGESNARA